jgi:hypothetical protein
MAFNTSKIISSRSWPLTPISADTTPILWVTHEVITKDAGLPTESIEHDWTLEARFPKIGTNADRNKVILGKASGQPEFDALLNVVRQAMVDARAGLGTM